MDNPKITALLIRDGYPDTEVLVFRYSNLLPDFLLCKDEKGEVYHVHRHSLKEIVIHEQQIPG